MKGIIKLFPVLNPTLHFVKGCIIKYNNLFYTVKKVGKVRLTLTNNVIVNKTDCKLMKYYVVNNNIKGELNYQQYNLVHDGDKFEYTRQIIPNKVEIGDIVVVFKPLLHNLAKYNFKSQQGVITNINGRKYTVNINGEDIEDVRRHRFKIISRPDKRVICTIITK